MNIKTHDEHRINSMLSNTRVIMCESCHRELADMVYSYEFSDGSRLNAQVCMRCYLEDDDEESFAISLLEKAILNVDVRRAIVICQIEDLRRE